MELHLNCTRKLQPIYIEGIDMLGIFQDPLKEMFLQLEEDK